MFITFFLVLILEGGKLSIIHMEMPNMDYCIAKLQLAAKDLDEYKEQILLQCVNVPVLDKQVI